MNLNIKIDFQHTYEIYGLAEDLSFFKFETINVNRKTKEETLVPLTVVFNNNRNLFLPEVYNLGFGPLKTDQTIDDRAELYHKDSSKVYSTILFGALSFMNRNINSVVGIDGSNLTRAYLYYRLLQTNYEYLTQFFRLYGVKYYVRLLRGETNSTDFQPDLDDIATYPSVIKKGESIRCEKLFNYFIFNSDDNLHTKH